jgi:hypothetical protein
MSSMGTVDAKNMTPSQRVLAMETLWESMCQEGTELSSPDWHENVLDERRSRIAAGGIGFVTLEQLRKKLGR